MAEVKNSFIKSKMNKDLDARLLPNGEYREGVNIQVSKSEGADVGALENTLGNLKLIDFSKQIVGGVEVIIPKLKTIGMYTDNLSDNLYIFLTDYNELDAADYNSQNLNYSKEANNYIYVYNTVTAIGTKLVEGAFLNFSQNFLINSVNLLEDILFFTDNRNQPRKINVLRALERSPSSSTTPTYYISEDQISVATYSPFQPIELYYKDNSLFLSNGGSGITETETIINATSIVLKSDGFKGINPGAKGPSGVLNTALLGAKLTTSLNASAGLVTGTTLDGYTPTTITVAAGKVDAIIPAGTTIFFNQTTWGTDYIDQYVTSMIDASSKMNPGETHVAATPGATTNRNYNPNFNGDPDFLEDKFVRFSYRFKYEDGEVSIMAPFTQPAFIPKQDGYFLSGDEDKAYRSTIVNFMENKVNNIFLQIPLPLDINNVGLKANQIATSLKINEIEILYKESDRQAVQVVDSIPRSGNNGFEELGKNLDGTYNDVLSYNYQGTKPFKTLPTGDLVRVYDKVPVRALTQELISNRVVYGNFQNKHTPPSTINYNVGASNKYSFSVSSISQPVLPSLERTSIREYPMHTLKQNRNYQVGIVFSDKFGRSSTTILSSASKQGSGDEGISFVGDTIYFPYNVESTTSAIGNDIHSWIGDSLKVLFNQPIDKNAHNLASGWPGLYNGDPTVDEYNPLGWYSYKIVVKQQEQEYYNVYLPGILNGYPKEASDSLTISDPVNTINLITLLNDNINKVPRDLTEVGPEQKQFRSAVQLYGRVTPNVSAAPSYNIQFNPGIIADTVSTIGEQNDLLSNIATPIDKYLEIYQTESNPLLARTTQTDISNPIGSLPMAASTYDIVLGIYETTPFESKIDIYWETSTTGTILQLNEAIELTSIGIQGFTTNTDMQLAPKSWTFNLYEDIQPDQSPNAIYDSVTGYTNQPASIISFFPYTVTAGTKSPVVESEINNFKVTNGLLEDATDRFTLVKLAGAGGLQTPDRYYIAISANTFFNYMQDSPVRDSFSFSFEVIDLSVAEEDRFPTTIILTEKLKNLKPIIDCPVSIPIPIGQTGNIYTFTGTNGSADTTNNKDNLTWAIASQSPAVGEPGAVPLIITTQPNGDGILSEETGVLRGTYTIDVTLTDAGTSSTTLGGSATTSCITSINGSTGYPTVNLNPYFYQIKNMCINGGFESSGFYWAKVNNTIGDANPVLGPAVPNANRTPFGTSGGPLYNPNIDTINDPRNVSQTSLAMSGSCSNWKLYNTNRNGTTPINADNSGLEGEVFDQASSFSLGGPQQQPLTEGSAYIIVSYNFEQYGLHPGINDNPSAIWPSFLQYRTTDANGTPTSTWATAKDVEGSSCRFGGTQTNNYDVSPNSNSFTLNQGVLDKENQASIPSPQSGQGFFSLEDAFEAKVAGRSDSDLQTIQTTGSKMFVVGKNQAYRDVDGNVGTPASDYPLDKFGEYRLVVRFPQGSNTPVSPNEAVSPLPNAFGDTCPPSGIYSNEGVGGAQTNITAFLSFGDFYNPTQLFNKYSGPNIIEQLGDSSVTSFAYYVTSGAYTSRNDAEQQIPNTTVYAREWGFRYVTQFYTDTSCTTPWTPVANEDRYYAYSGVANPVVENPGGLSNINVRYGNESSNTRAAGVPISESFDFQRKWTAEFDQFGKKKIKTAKPCSAELATAVPTPSAPNNSTLFGGSYTLTSVENNTGLDISWSFSNTSNTSATAPGYAELLARAFVNSDVIPEGSTLAISGLASTTVYIYYGLTTIPNQAYQQVNSIDVTNGTINWSQDGTQAIVKLRNCNRIPSLGAISDNYLWVLT